MDGNTESEPIYYRERERGIPIHGKIKQERERIKSSTHTHCTIITLTCTTTYYLHTMYITPNLLSAVSSRYTPVAVKRV